MVRALAVEIGKFRASRTKLADLKVGLAMRPGQTLMGLLEKKNKRAKGNYDHIIEKCWTELMKVPPNQTWSKTRHQRKLIEQQTQLMEQKRKKQAGSLNRGAPNLWQKANDA